MTKHKLAIVGGGFLGAELAKALDADMDVTLIERASHFTHTPAMIRAMVDPTLLDRALMPYDRLLTRGEVMHAEAVAVDGDGVTLADGTLVPADSVVLATGSANFSPFKSADGDLETLRADNARWHKAMVAASRIVIIGAGTVGTELAGEIAHAHPEKEITLVSGDTVLFPDLPSKMGQSLKFKLEAMGVEVMLGAQAESLPGKDAPDPVVRACAEGGSDHSHGRLAGAHLTGRYVAWL
jgi:NADH dehydrogenase FAD-containing subunit